MIYYYYYYYSKPEYRKIIIIITIIIFYDFTWSFPYSPLQCSTQMHLLQPVRLPLEIA